MKIDSFLRSITEFQMFNNISVESRISQTVGRTIITVRNSSCRKVVFTSVCLSTGGGVTPPPGQIFAGNFMKMKETGGGGGEGLRVPYTLSNPTMNLL